MNITKEQFIEDSKTLTALEMSKKYDCAIATIYKKAKELDIALKQQKKGRKPVFNF